MNVHLFFSRPLAGLTNRPPVRDSDPGTPLVIPTIILTIAWEEVLILTLTNKPKLLILFHGILVYTGISLHIFWIPEGKYVIDLFSDASVIVYGWKFNIN